MKLTKTALYNYFIEGCKPLNQNKIGIEIEHFVCNKNTLNPINKSAILKVLSLLPSNKWCKSYLNHELTQLNNHLGNISLEPGLQLEFSSAPEFTLNQLDNSYNFFLKDIYSILNKNNYALLTLGHHPFLTPSTTPFKKGTRYNIMYDYMPKVGTLGRNMMKNTTTLQTNVDYNNETDLLKKIQVLANITPFLIYLSASSPFKSKKITPYLSYRNYIWQHTDKARTGMPEYFFKGQFSIEKYIDSIINIPIYFIIRNNKYIPNPNNYTFLDLMQNKIKNFSATKEDFITHLSTIFFDIRIKKYLEIRSCDTIGIKNVCSIPAFITGLLYSSESLEELYSLTKTWDKNTFLSLKKHLNTKGLTNDKINNINLVKTINLLIELSNNGLKQRKLKEEKFLLPLQSIIKTKTNLAQQYINTFHNYNNIFDFTKSILWK